jgi:hypothetical protein
VSAIDRLQGGGIRTANRRRLRKGPGASQTRGVEAGAGKPLDLVGYGARLVVQAIDWRDDVGRIVGYHDVAEHESSAGPEPVGDAGEEVRLTCSVEMVHGERRHDEVEAASGSGSWRRLTRRSAAARSPDASGEHLRTLIDADQLRLWVEVEHPPGRLRGANAQFQHPLGMDTGGRLGDGVLQLLIRRHLRTDGFEVAGRVEMDLVPLGSVSH